MTWWQILLVFVCIPAAMFASVTALVLRFATARVPDGLARAVENPAPETGHHKVGEAAASIPDPPSDEPQRPPPGE